MLRIYKNDFFYINTFSLSHDTLLLLLPWLYATNPSLICIFLSFVDAYILLFTNVAVYFLALIYVIRVGRVRFGVFVLRSSL